MSQQNLQQRLDPDIHFAPSERPKRRRPTAAANAPLIAALALTASFILAALVHVSSYARLAHLEYRRQALTADARLLEAAVQQLRFEVERARAQERVSAVAVQWDMAPADPASEVDYVILPVGGGADSPGFPALLRDVALTRQVTAITSIGFQDDLPTAGAVMARP